MITTAQQILDSFDALPESDKRQVAAEILRRTSSLPDDDLMMALHLAADEGFALMDAAEAAGNGDTDSSSR